MTLDGRKEINDTLNVAQTGIVAESLYECFFDEIMIQNFQKDAFRANGLFIANTLSRIKTELIRENGLFIGFDCNANRITSCRLRAVIAREGAERRGAGIRFDGHTSFANSILSCGIESNDIGIDIVGAENPQKAISIAENHFENNRDVDIQVLGTGNALHGLSIRNNWVTYGPFAGRLEKWLRLSSIRQSEIVGNVNTKWGVEFVDEASTLDCYFAANQSVQFRSDFLPQFLERQPVIPRDYQPEQ